MCFIIKHSQCCLSLDTHVVQNYFSSQQSSAFEQIKLIKVLQNDFLHCTSILKRNILRRSVKTVENLTLPFVQLKKGAKDSRDSRFLSRIQKYVSKLFSKSQFCSRQWRSSIICHCCFSKDICSDFYTDNDVN